MSTSTLLCPHLWGLCIALAALLSAAATTTLADDGVAPISPQLVLVGGKIVTVDDQFRVAEALAVRDGKILRVGTSEEILSLVRDETKVIDLGGKVVIPGLIDSHVHPSSASMHEFDHPVPDMQSIADVLAYIKSRAMVLPEGEWIVVRQVFITRLKEPRYPTRRELDEVAPKHPVLFSTGPDAMCNSLALKLSEITRDTVVTGTGFIEKDRATGEPTGLLRNCTRLVKTKSSGKTATEDDRLARLEQLFAAYNRVGITTVADKNASGDDISRYSKLKSEQRLSVRLRLSHALDGSAKIEAIEERLRQIIAHPLTQPDEQLQIIGVKSFLDGGMLTGSAYMREPWGVSEVYSISDPEYRGVRMIDDEKLVAMVRQTAAAGLQFTAHSVGDGAVTALLEAYARVNAETPIAATRPCITHCNFLTADAIERMHELGVVADIQPAWLYLDARTLHGQFGEKRLRYFQPLKTLIERGVTVGGGSDHMQKLDPLLSINPYDPWLGISTTITREARWFDQKLHAEECLTRAQALRFYTALNARVLRMETFAGTIEPGKQADLVILDRDLLTCDVAEIRGTKVLATYLGGRLVYEAPR